MSNNEDDYEIEWADEHLVSEYGTEINLILDYREAVKPFAEKIARSRDASVVLLVDQSVFWLDPAIDITGDVISALRAERVFAGSDADQVSATLPTVAPVETPAAATAE